MWASFLDSHKLNGQNVPMPAKKKRYLAPLKYRKSSRHPIWENKGMKCWWIPVQKSWNLSLGDRASLKNCTLKNCKDSMFHKTKPHQKKTTNTKKRQFGKTHLNPSSTLFFFSKISPVVQLGLVKSRFLRLFDGYNSLRGTFLGLNGGQACCIHRVEMHLQMGSLSFFGVYTVHL